MEVTFPCCQRRQIHNKEEITYVLLLIKGKKRKLTLIYIAMLDHERRLFIKVYSREIDLSTIANKTRKDSYDNPDVCLRHFERADQSNLNQYNNY